MEKDSFFRLIRLRTLPDRTTAEFKIDGIARLRIEKRTENHARSNLVVILEYLRPIWLLSDYERLRRERRKSQEQKVERETGKTGRGSISEEWFGICAVLKGDFCLPDECGEQDEEDGSEEESGPEDSGRETGVLWQSGLLSIISGSLFAASEHEDRISGRARFYSLSGKKFESVFCSSRHY